MWVHRELNPSSLGANLSLLITEPLPLLVIRPVFQDNRDMPVPAHQTSLDLNSAGDDGSGSDNQN